MTCEIDDPKWSADESMMQQMYADLEAENICTKDDVVEVHIQRSTNGYPIFSLGFEEHLQRIKDYIDSLDNFQSTGRQGGFCYPNMHAAMRLGANAADKVMQQFK